MRFIHYLREFKLFSKPRDTTFKFDASTLKSSLKFVVEHSYFSVGSVSFKQLIGIPIGVDCAPPVANLTLFRYEYQYMNRLLRSDYRRALRFNGCFRLMDDISVINSDGIFEEDVSSIYPASLELKKENDGNESANILDLTVNLDVNCHKFTYKLFDKRDKFKFKIVNYPDICSNISMKCCYGVVKSELKRYIKLSSNFSDYIDRKNILLDKLLAKGYSSSRFDSIFHSLDFHKK